MPTRRVPLNRRRTVCRITPEVLALFARVYHAETTADLVQANYALADVINGGKLWPDPCTLGPHEPYTGKCAHDRACYEQARKNFDRLEEALLEHEARPERNARRKKAAHASAPAD